MGKMPIGSLPRKSDTHVLATYGEVATKFLAFLAVQAVCSDSASRPGLGDNARSLRGES